MATGKEQSKEVEGSQSVLNENGDDTLLSYGVSLTLTHTPHWSLNTPYPPPLLPEQAPFSVTEGDGEMQPGHPSDSHYLPAISAYFLLREKTFLDEILWTLS